MTLNLRQLDTFLWVATLGSFRKTAERLYTTQPAVSARIANLEASLGAKLFERSTGTVRLTAKGQALLPQVEQLLRMADDLRETAGGPAGLSGMLRLGVAETIVHTWLPVFLAELHRTMPKVDVEITVDTTVSLRNDLVARSLDLALLMGPVSEFSIVNLDLPTSPLVWAAAPKLGLGKDRELSLAELLRFPILTYARKTRPYLELANLVRSAGNQPARLFPSSSLAAALRMTIDGIGIAMLPRQLVEQELARGRLIELRCDWKPTDLQFTASFSANPFNPVAERAATLAQKVAEQQRPNAPKVHGKRTRQLATRLQVT